MMVKLVVVGLSWFAESPASYHVSGDGRRQLLQKEDSE
jgi:hypothetical protein